MSTDRHRRATDESTASSDGKDVASVPMERTPIDQDLSFSVSTIENARLLRPRRRGEVVEVAPTRLGRNAPTVHLGRIACGNDNARPLAERRSERIIGPIGCDQLASTLLAANRVLASATGDDGYSRTWRPNPSAGGRHPVDLLVDTHDVNGIAVGAWWFDAMLGALRPADIDLTEARQAVSAAAGVDSPPAATVFLIASFDRTLANYDHGTMLVWRDVGALAAILQIAAAGAHLSSCIIGTAGLVDLDDGAADCAAVMLGPHRDARARE